MIVFDLKCGANAHVFEAWFRSSADYDDQKARGLLRCPLCDDGDIGKAVMAPAVPAKANSRADNSSVPAPAAAAINAPSPADLARLHAMMTSLAKAQKRALEGSQWVGRQFAETARAMHYGERDSGAIHGEVAPEEARALMEEGVPVAPLPFPVVPPEAQN